MKRTILAAGLAAVLSPALVSQAQSTQPPPLAEKAPETPNAAGVREVSYASTDDTTIHADLYLPGKDAPSGEDPDANPLSPVENAAPHALILAFHMAGANARAEYAPLIAPRLAQNGYAVLTPDLRLGGSRIGGVNRTTTALAEAGVEELPSYCDAYPDVVATLDFAENWLAEHYPEATGEDTIPIIALGSSYTATLVLRLAAEEGERLAGVLSCSPAAGDPMTGCQPEDFYEKITVPRMILIPEREAQSKAKRNFLTNARVLGFRVHIEPGGVHGSLLLDPQQNADKDTEKAWSLVLAFLSGL